MSLVELGHYIATRREDLKAPVGRVTGCEVCVCRDEAESLCVDRESAQCSVSTRPVSLGRTVTPVFGMILHRVDMVRFGITGCSDLGVRIDFSVDSWIGLRFTIGRSTRQWRSRRRRGSVGFESVFEEDEFLVGMVVELRLPVEDARKHPLQETTTTVVREIHPDGV